MSKKILVVDDSKVQRRVISQIIEKSVSNYEILQAGNGQEALAVLKDHLQDVVLILSDWNMPVMTGRDFLAAIASQWPDFKAKVVMVTTEGTEEKLQKARETFPLLAGYLTKPFTPEEFQKAIIPFLK